MSDRGDERGLVERVAVLEALYKEQRTFSAELQRERERRLDERKDNAETAVAAALASQKEAVAAAFTAAKEALATATTTLDDRLALLNELRGNVLEVSAFDQYVQRADERWVEAGRQREALQADIATLRTAIAVGPTGLTALQSETAATAARTQGIASFRSEIVAVLALLIAVASVVVLAVHG